MNIITATELLRSKVRQQKRDNLLELVRLIELENPYSSVEGVVLDCDDNLVINIDESCLTIDGRSIESWLSQNAQGLFNSDKWVTVDRLI